MIGNLRNCSENVGHFWKTSETVQKFFPDVFMIFKIFRNLRNFLENFGNGSKVIFRCYYDILNFSKNLRKCSQIVGDIFASKDIENILRGTRMYCHMDSMSGLFSSKTLLPI